MIKKIITPIIIMAVLGILLYLAIPHRSCRDWKIKLPRVGNIIKIANLNTGIDLYKLHHGQYPNPELGLSNLLTSYGEENWSGPYVHETNNCLIDYWGTPFKYEIVNEIPFVISAGADKHFNSFDDFETNHRVNLEK
jgi:hypothetical protein